MPQQPITFQEPTTPWPPRYRWLKRSGWIVLSTLLILFLIRLGWGWLAERRLNKIIAEIRARGEPIERADFDQPPIPDSQNAAWYYRKAFAAITNQAGLDVWSGWDYTDTTVYRSTLMDPVNSNPAAVAWARQAQDHDAVVWYAPIQVSLIFMHQPDMNHVRSLDDDLVLDAWREHQLGHEPQALMDLRAGHHLADACWQNFPSVISNLVSLGVDAISSGAAIGLSRDLQIGDAHPTATRQDVLDLIADLSDERQFRRGGSRFLVGQRATDLDTLRTMSLMPFPLNLSLKPMVQSETADMMDWATSAMPAWSAPNYQAALSIIPPLPGGIDMKLNPMFMNQSNFKRSLLIYFADMENRRAAVLALAIRLYRHDHHKRWPATLGDLVPAELPSLPVDPFAPDGATFRYHPNAPGGPILYSVGQNDIDDGGKEIVSPHQLSWLDQPDIVYHLTEPAPPH